MFINPPAPNSPAVTIPATPILSAAQLQKAIPSATPANVTKFIGPLVATMLRHQINTPLRIAHFLAQVAHESGCLRYSEELASGEAYEGRANLGNTHVGDGVKFKGRGLIQLTGRTNYTAFAEYLNNADILTNPAIVATNPEWAAETAGWFWDTHRLNEYADRNDAAGITKIINGGLNGLSDRLACLVNCKSALGCVA